jgi:hypothetical protein
VTYDNVRRLALALPRVVEGTSYGTAAFHVGKKFLLRLKEDGGFITDHYRNYPAVLVCLGKIRERERCAMFCSGRGIS